MWIMNLGNEKGMWLGWKPAASQPSIELVWHSIYQGSPAQSSVSPSPADLLANFSYSIHSSSQEPDIIWRQHFFTRQDRKPAALELTEDWVGDPRSITKSSWKRQSHGSDLCVHVYPEHQPPSLPRWVRRGRCSIGGSGDNSLCPAGSRYVSVHGTETYEREPAAAGWSDLWFCCPGWPEGQEDRVTDPHSFSAAVVFDIKVIHYDILNTCACLILNQSVHLQQSKTYTWKELISFCGLPNIHALLFNLSCMLRCLGPITMVKIL